MSEQLTQTKGGRLFLYGTLETKDELDEVFSFFLLRSALLLELYFSAN